MESVASQSKYVNTRRILCYIVLVFFAIISLFPIYAMIINCTRSHGQITGGFSFIPGSSFLKNFVNLAINKETTSPFWQGLIQKYDIASKGNYAQNYPVLHGMLNSLVIAFLTAAFTTYFSAMTAYGIYMYNFKLKKFSFRFIMAVMMVPSQVSTLGFIRLLDKMHLMESYVGLIVPSIAAPIVFFYMFQSMEATLPYSIVEAARVDGCNEFRTFNQIAIPMLKPAFAVQAIFAFVTSWNNYFIPSLVLTEKAKWTVPIVIAAARNADYMNNDQGISYMLMTLAIVPLTIVYFILSKYIIEGTAAGGVKE